MKKLRIFFMIILSIILIVWYGKNIESYPGDGELWISPAFYGSSGAIYYHISPITAQNNDNVYCIKQGYALMDSPGSHPKCYTRTAKAEMVGDQITLKTYDAYGNRKKTKTKTRVEADYILAAILCHGDDLGMWSYGNTNTSSQLALFEYWNTWRSASGGSYFPSGGGSGGGSASYASVAKGIAYDLTIELYEPESSGYQNVIIVHREGSWYRVPPTIDIGVSKSWSDSDDAYRNRPSSVTAYLYKDGSSTGKSLTLNSSNGWNGTFSGLESGTGYSVQESSVPTGYSVSYGGSQSNGFTITNTLKTTSLKVEKTWSDLENCYGLRPTTVNFKLMRQRVDEKEDAEYVKDVTITEEQNWKGTISNLPLYVKGYEMKYWVEEIDPDNYTQEINYDTETNTYKAVNTLGKLDIKVTKKWEDDDNYYKNRPQTVRVYLYINGVKQNNKYIDLKGPDWEGSFTGLEPVKGYTVKEEEITGYTASTTGTVKDGFSITNTLERTSVSVEKIWDDENNELRLRPATIKISLWQNVNGVESEFINAKGEHLYKTLRGTNTSYPLKDKFTNLPKYIDGVEVYYTVREEEDKNPGLFENYMLKDEPIPYDRATNSFIITNVLAYDGYKEIKGRVWVDGEAGKASAIDGKFDVNKDTALEGIKVTLRDENGNQFDPTSTTTTDIYGEYTIKINYDNSREVYKLYEDVDIVNEKLKKAYVEFEYDGILYTTISNVGTESIVEEDVNKRTNLDNNYATVPLGYNNQKLEKVKNDKNVAIEIKPKDEKRQITARTKTLETTEFKNATTINEWEADETTLYCKGSSKYIRTNTKGAWLEPVEGTCSSCQRKEHTRITKIDVETIQNVNCALFEREQPDVAIFSDIEKVEVVMNNQKYTYLYGVRTTEIDKNYGVLAKFQNANTYTYRRPVNPADVAYIKDNHSDAMNVYVTYGIYVGNLSSTLNITVDKLVNYYDSNYEIRYGDEENATQRYHIKYGKMDKKGEISGVSIANENISTNSKGQYNEVTLNKLGISVTNQNPSENKIYIRYKIKQDDKNFEKLFNNEPPLNNATEILSYTTRYGRETIYAGYRPNSKEGKGGRTDNFYGGYDFDSHPGNAGIQINRDGRLEASKAEDDTDIAPAFVLVKDPNRLKTLSGTVWEDKKADISNILGREINEAERLGNGYKDGNEKMVKNVKVDLYNLDGTPAIRYKVDGSKYDDDIYTNENGEYWIPGIVTGEYYVKYTYGNYDKAAKEEKPNIKEDETILENTTTIKGGIKVNARDYKSTIITEKLIEDIFRKDYANFSEEEKKWHITHENGYSVAVDNMTDRLMIDDLTYGTYNLGVNMTAYTMPFKTQVEFKTDGLSNSNSDGVIDVSNVLDNIDFGIIERPRENLLVQKTISYFKITLANGQVLTEGNPKNGDINYAKTLGFRQNIRTALEAKNALEKKLIVEMDAELIQGAKMDVKYDVTVINNNEIDYNYGTLNTYAEETENRIFISKQPEAQYYYFGKPEDLEEIEATIEFIDYLDEDLVYNEEEALIDGWEVENNLTDLVDKVISIEAKNAIERNRYKVLRTLEATRKITLGRNSENDNNKFTQSMTASRLLSNQEENVFDNNAEIIFIDSKTARTVKDVVETDEGPKPLDYTPGNYEPSLEPREEILESDDDRVEIRITPPTGITTNIIQYVIIALVGLIIAFIGITFIKKKA